MKRDVIFLYLLISLIIFISLVDAGQNRIGTRQVDGVWEFYDNGTGQKFVPRGNNYVNTSEYYQPIYLYPAFNFTAARGANTTAITLATGYYNPAIVNASFNEMKNRGYNIVRVFFDAYQHTPNNVNPEERLNKSYMDNTIDFIKLAKENDMYVILAWGWLAPTYYDIVNQTCDNNVPEYEYTNATIVHDYTFPYVFENYTVCGHQNVSGNNVIYMHQGVINATKHYILDVLGNITKNDSSLTNGTILAVEMIAEPYFRSNSFLEMPFYNKTMSLTITLQQTETYDMSNNMSRQGLADNATKYWIDNIAPEINQSYPNILLSAALITPYGFNNSGGYNGVQTSTAQSHRSKIYVESPYISYLDFHLYPLPKLDDSLYNITRDLQSAEISINSTGIYANKTLIQKPIIMSEFGVTNITHPLIEYAVNNLTKHQNNSCEYHFTGWVYWMWDHDKIYYNPNNDEYSFWWRAFDGVNNEIAENLSPFYRPDPCSQEHKQYRRCGDIENDDPRESACQTYVSDFTQCNDDNKCVYDSTCYTDDGNYNTSEYTDVTYGDLTCEQGRWCPVGFDWNIINQRCEFQYQWGQNRFIIQDVNGNNVAKLDDKGHIVLKGTCTATPTCTAPADSFIFKDSSWNTVAYIDSNGNLCIEDANCNYNDVSCNPLNNVFIIQDIDKVNQIYIDLTNGNLCLKGYLYENSNP